MRVYHASPRKNKKSILKHGLLTSKSQGKRKVIWLHSDFNWEWAIEHVAKRHDCKESDVIIYCVEIADRYFHDPAYSGLKRTHMLGIYTVDWDIPAQCISEQSYLAGRAYRSLNHAK